MLLSEESLKPSDVAETADLIRFNTSLQELRDIQSQLHYAADYCESMFMESNEKKEVVENTKEYICRAIVTMVDHLGNVSSNLTTRLLDASSFPNSDTELRVDSLQHRVMSSERFGSEFAMAKLRWSVDLPRYHSRYLLSHTNFRKSTQGIRSLDSSSSSFGDKSEVVREEGLPLFMYTFPMRSSGPNSSEGGDSDEITIVPVRDGSTKLYKSPSSNFRFQGSHKKQRNSLDIKSVHRSDVLGLIRRFRRMSTSNHFIQKRVNWSY